MMFLEPEVIIKRVALVLAAVILAAMAGATVWYNYNLGSEFQAGQVETNQLRQETSRLGAMTDDVRETMYAELQRLRQEHNQSKTELRTDIVKFLEENARLRAQIKIQEEQLQDLKQKLDREIEWRNKNLWFRN